MSISKHTTYNVAGAVIPLGVTLVTVPLYLQVVGVERYGLLTICWVVLGYLGFLDLGLGPAVSQRIASAREEDRGLAEAVFWTAVWLSVAAGLFTALLFFAGAALYFLLGGVSASFDGEIRQAVPLLGLVLPLAMVSSVAAGALHGRQRFLALNLISTTTATLMSALPLLVAYLWSPTLSGLLAGALAARAVGLVLQYWNCVKAVPLSKPEMPRRELVGSLLKFGGWITVTTAVTPLLLTVDRLAIGAALGAAAVAAYSIPFSLIARMSIVPWGLSSALFPRFAAGSEDERRHLLGVALGAVTVAMTPLCILVIAVVGPFFTLWIGPELAQVSSPVAYLLIAGIWANSVALVPYTMLQGSGRPDVVAKIHLAEILPYWLLLGALLLLLGLPGAALAWTIRAAVDCGLMFWRSATPRASLRILIVPGLLLLVVLISALALKGLARDLVLVLLLAASGAWSFRTMPEPLWAHLRTLAGYLPWKRPPARSGP
ncbi:MAG TPA: oligosaccharide flippase family protein [Allosphingosinicella sp.]|nr:oligosaccharide flippase family protein [Allosphingosinicella sp.]